MSRPLPPNNGPYEPRSRQYPLPAMSSQARNSDQSLRALESKRVDDQVKITLKNIDPETTANQLREILEKFGDIVDISIDTDEYNKINAKVIFEKKPGNTSGLFKIRMHGKLLELEVEQAVHQNYCSAESISLGQMLKPNIFCKEFTATSAVTIQFQENRKMVKLTFRRRFADVNIKYFVEMRLRDMEKGCVQVDDFERTATITIRLRYPPTYWRYDPNMEVQDANKWNESYSLRRVVDIPNENSEFHGPANRKIQPIEPNPPNLSSKLGRWTVIHLTVNTTTRRNMSQLSNFIDRCRLHNLLNMESEEKDIVRVVNTADVPRPQTSLLNDLPFEARYMLESTLSTNYIIDHDLTPGAVEILRSLEPLKASMILSGIISQRRRVWDLEAYLARESKKLSGITCRPRVVPAQCVFLRKIIVTPTTIQLQSPSVETSNRIIRHFSHLSDYFLRVEFSDEGSNRIWSRDSTSNENNAIYNRIFTALMEGIKIGDRKYEFLAFSASQLRENSAWFFCSQGGSDTVDSIHRWMGDFSHIKSIAKYAARMGQCFSSTRAIDNLSADEVVLIDDIQRDNQIFSDGCGKISLTLAQKIAHELGKDYMPVAFQIRLGGSKGVLAWNPQLRNKCVHVRRSMKKFDVDHYVLEVIKTSSYIPSYLNRQIIILLSALGVPDKVILDLKNKMVRDLEDMESDDITAITILSQNCDENGTSKMMIDMIRAGFLRRQDPYIKNLITLFKLHMLEELSKRARIFVPNGAYLMGVCDETSKLKEGEIFIQISSVENPSRRKVITGKCAVVRCPCFHPGDIRVVNAVDCPELKHLYDVVVFNTQGTRGIPSMCSGGDLDGDEYTVIWDPFIVDNIKEHPPMSYTGSETVIERDVEIHEIKKFFVQYAVSNNLGLIANAHLALSDKLKDGPMDGKCLRLAQLHSDAVDFPKSGKPAIFTNDLKPKVYPDFMEKPISKTYESSKVLGIIFRECREVETFTPKDYNASLYSPLLVKGYEKYLLGAIELKAGFDEDVLSLMNQYGVKSDLEIASGFFMGIDVITNKKEYDVRKSIVTAYLAIKRRYRTEFEQEFYAPGSKKVLATFKPEVEKKAAAWYAACYQNMKHDQSYSFAWVVWDYLCEMARVYRPRANLEDTSINQLVLQDNVSRNRYRNPQGMIEIDSGLLVPKKLNKDVYITKDSIIIGPDVDDNELREALGYITI